MRHLAGHDGGRALLVAQVHHLVEKERVALGAVEDPRLDLRLDFAGAAAHESRGGPAESSRAIGSVDPSRQMRDSSSLASASIRASTSR